MSAAVRDYFDQQTAAEERQFAEEQERAARELQARMERLQRGGRLSPDVAELVARGDLPIGEAIKMGQPDKPQRFRVGKEIVEIGPDGTPNVLYQSREAVAAAGGGGMPAPNLMPDGSPIRDKFDQAVADGRLTPAQAEQARQVEFGLAPKPTAETQGRVDRNRNASNNILSSIDQLESGFNEGRFRTGPIDGPLNYFTSDSQFLRSEVASIVAALRQLERVPGSGADTDRELQFILDQAPSVMTNERAALEMLGRLRRKAAQYRPFLDGMTGQDAFNYEGRSSGAGSGAIGYGFD